MKSLCKGQHLALRCPGPEHHESAPGALEVLTPLQMRQRWLPRDPVRAQRRIQRNSS
ncbi:mCG148065 [Mus musculus]|nr:mCG148065 [Mus musculus]